MSLEEKMTPNRRSKIPHPALIALTALFVLAPSAPAEDPAPPQEIRVDDLRSRTDGSDWPAFLGPTGDGKSPETGIRKDWSQGLPIAWQLELGEGYSAPSVAQGRIFVFDREKDEARLRCLRSETGEELWQSTYPTTYEDMYDYSGGPRTSPVIDEGRVFVFGVDGRLRAHHAGTGDVLWEVDTEKAYGVQQNFFGVGSTPVIEGNLLIAQVGGSPPDSPGVQSGKVKPNGTAIVAFDKTTGKEVYRLGDELASYASLKLADIDGERWGFAFVRGGLLGFDPVRGQQRFHFPWRATRLESVNASTPVVVGRRVLITESYGPGGVLLEIPEEGCDDGCEPKVVWKDARRHRSVACHWSTPIHHEGVIYTSSGAHSGNAELRAVDFDTGEVLWTVPGKRRSTLLQVDGHFVVLGEYGELWLVEVNPEKYVEVGEWIPKNQKGDPLLAFPAWNAPILAQGLLYVRGKDRLLALELIPPSSSSGAGASGVE